MSDSARAAQTLESLELESGDVRAWFAPTRGGLLTRLFVDGEHVLYLDRETLENPEKNVRGGVPILFPIAGKLPEDTYQLGETRYTLKQHGFARNLPWHVTKLTENSVTMRFQSADAKELRSQYPFDFSLEFTYELQERGIAIHQKFTHVGGADLQSLAAMPLQPGLHPYFIVPKKSDCRVLTSASRGHDNVSNRAVELAQPINLDRSDLDLQILDHPGNEIRLERPPMRTVKLAWIGRNDAIVLWTIPGRDFVCVEPWSAQSGTLTGGVPRLQPGESLELTFIITLES